MNTKVIVLKNNVDVNKDIDVFSNLTGKIDDKELTDLIIDCVKIDEEVTIL